MDDKKKKLIISIVLGVIFLGLVGYVIWGGGLKNINLTKKTDLPPEAVQQTIKNEQGEEIKVAVVATGTSAITETGEVVNPTTGKEVKNDVIPGSPEAPQQSNPVEKEAIPASTVKLSVTASGFSPTSFTVKPGTPVSLAVTSADTFTHIFKFRDPALQAVAVGLLPQETRIITFDTPTKAGEYEFYCDVPGHGSRGEIGKMIVQ